jgi:hypothetical protein
MDVDKIEREAQSAQEAKKAVAAPASAGAGQ